MSSHSPCNTSIGTGNAEQGGQYYQQMYDQQTQQVAQAQSHQNLSTQAGQHQQQQQGTFGVPLLRNPTANLSNSFQNLFSRPFGEWGDTSASPDADDINDSFG